MKQECRALGSLYWVHNASNSEFTYQSTDKKRGLDGIKTNEVSVVFKGIVFMTAGLHIGI